MKHGSEHRYSRQILLPEIGPEGQERLGTSRVAVVGCGALGSVIASLLARAGVGSLRIIDRDFVEPSNLQRQLLFDESDAKSALPKAVAAERHLRAANAEVAIEGVVADVTPRNVEELLAGRDLILDGTDNFETRFLINDFAVKNGVPWIYAAVVGMRGVCLPIVPGKTACLACIAESGNGEALADEETCDTVGVLGAAAAAVASLASAAAIRMLTGAGDGIAAKLTSIDVWNGEQRNVRVARDPDCRACARREFTYLQGAVQPHVTMCGRDSVQIHERNRRIDLSGLGARLGAVVTDVRRNDFLLRFRVAPYEVTVFSDGRAIIKGTRDPGVARSLYARYLGA
ncbi:MAG TPA: ThiF family adenylyltransferase [Candidatus Acidoferrales bacterium]|nr:ThiF family adenylyltransferase [Candidatus Acidoferrales bacterium]